MKRWLWPYIPLMMLSFVTMVLSQMYTIDGAAGPDLSGAVAYAVCGFTILFAHEMGHYLMCLRHDVEASPPYFLPGIPLGLGATIPMIGTFGAFIKMELATMSRSALLRIGAWGPIAGFVPTIPILFYGFSLSEVKPVGDGVQLGDAAIMLIAQQVFFPGMEAGFDVYLHPIAFAGWMGTILTAINLLPIGQLDGGHIVYALFGKRTQTYIPYVLMTLLMVMGFFFWIGWFVLAALIRFFGVVHPDITNDEPLTRSDWIVGGVTLIIFVLTFTPTPMEGGSGLSLIMSFF